MPPSTDNRATLELIRGKDGSVQIGWLAAKVLYSRIRGGFTASIAHAYATRLNVLIAPTQSLCFFCDLSDLKNYDLLARSSLARVILSNRRKLSAVTVLVPNEGASSQTRALVGTLGEPVEVLTQRNKFETLLARKAPEGMQKLDPKFSTLPSNSVPLVR